LKQSTLTYSQPKMVGLLLQEELEIYNLPVQCTAKTSSIYTR